jgi:uncharacterized repeat protein (TIGR03803 family)
MFRTAKLRNSGRVGGAMRGTGASGVVSASAEIREKMAMSVTGRYSVFQRACRSWANSIRRISKGPSVLRHPCVLALAAFGVFLAGGPAAMASPALTTLAEFKISNGFYLNGANPKAGLIADAAGNLYGTTSDGGAGGLGTVFQVAAGTHALSTLVTFNNLNGAGPSAGLIADSAGNLYGTTGGDGVKNYGTVFEIAAGTHALSTLATFNNTNGANPVAGLIADTAGNLYGTTDKGGANGWGTVFEVAAGTHALSTLATFNFSNGGFPVAGLIADAAGNLYGTTLFGGANNGFGTVFQVAAGTHALSNIVTFNGLNGAEPSAGLIADATGNLYGTTRNGGASSDGTVFELAASTHVLTTLATFNGTNGVGPEAGLIADAAGNLYGTTGGDGMNNYGTVFEVAAGTHALSTLATFNNSNGDDPAASLVADASGNLYGTTHLGGANASGTVFELSDTGFVTSTPEPGGTLLIGLSGIGLLGRRRRPLGAQ